MELPVIEWKEDEKVTRDEKCRGGLATIVRLGWFPLASSSAAERITHCQQG